MNWFLVPLFIAGVAYHAYRMIKANRRARADARKGESDTGQDSKSANQVVESKKSLSRPAVFLPYLLITVCGLVLIFVFVSSSLRHHFIDKYNLDVYFLYFERPQTAQVLVGIATGLFCGYLLEHLTALKSNSPLTNSVLLTFVGILFLLGFFLPKIESWLDRVSLVKTTLFEFHLADTVGQSKILNLEEEKVEFERTTFTQILLFQDTAIKRDARDDDLEKALSSLELRGRLKTKPTLSVKRKNELLRRVSEIEAMGQRRSTASKFVSGLFKPLGLCIGYGFPDDIGDEIVRAAVRRLARPLHNFTNLPSSSDDLGSSRASAVEALENLADAIKSSMIDLSAHSSSPDVCEPDVEEFENSVKHISKASNFVDDLQRTPYLYITNAVIHYYSESEHAAINSLEKMVSIFDFDYNFNNIYANFVRFNGENLEFFSKPLMNSIKQAKLRLIQAEELIAFSNRDGDCSGRSDHVGYFSCEDLHDHAEAMLARAFLVEVKAKSAFVSAATVEFAQSEDHALWSRADIFANQFDEWAERIRDHWREDGTWKKEWERPMLRDYLDAQYRRIQNTASFWTIVNEIKSERPDGEKIKKELDIYDRIIRSFSMEFGEKLEAGNDDEPNSAERRALRLELEEYERNRDLAKQHLSK